jgi:hypothetical protein
MEEEINTKDFKYKHTMILYLVYEGFKKGVLSSEEKSILKELIFYNHPILEQNFSVYESHGNVELFWIQLKAICENRDYEILREPDTTGESSTEEDYLKELSSPLDFILIKKKKNYQKTKMEKEFLEKSEENSFKEADSLNLTSLSVITNNWVKLCEEGPSPKIQQKFNQSV